MPLDDSATEELLRRAGQNDRAAIDDLLRRHRGRVKQMINIRMDQRLAARLDASDIVQEAFIDASRKMKDYLKDREIPFYPWLRELAINRLIDFHRRHILAQKRAVEREEPWATSLPDRSTLQLAERLLATGQSPSRQVSQREMQSRVKAALSEMQPVDREVLVLKYLETLTTAEIASVLRITERSVRRRHGRAIERLGYLLRELNED